MSENKIHNHTCYSNKRPSEENYVSSFIVVNSVITIQLSIDQVPVHFLYEYKMNDSTHLQLMCLEMKNFLSKENVSLL